MGLNLVPLVNIKIAGKWVFTPLTLIIIGFDTHPNHNESTTRMPSPSKSPFCPRSPTHYPDGRGYPSPWR